MCNDNNDHVMIGEFDVTVGYRHIKINQPHMIIVYHCHMSHGVDPLLIASFNNEFWKLWQLKYSIILPNNYIYSHWLSYSYAVNYLRYVLVCN